MEEMFGSLRWSLPSMLWHTRLHKAQSIEEPETSTGNSMHTWARSRMNNKHGKKMVFLERKLSRVGLHSLLKLWSCYLQRKHLQKGLSNIIIKKTISSFGTICSYHSLHEIWTFVPIYQESTSWKASTGLHVPQKLEMEGLLMSVFQFVASGKLLPNTNSGAFCPL